MPDAATLLEAGAKAVLYLSLLFAIGASALRWLLLPRATLGLGAVRIRMLEGSAARLALRAAIVALAACLLRMWTHTVSAFGFSDSGWDNLKLIALESRWGVSWKLQTAAAVILVLASAATVWRRAAWPAASLAVLLFTATIPQLGHAAGDPLREVLHLVHIFAAGVWLGTLGVVLLVRIPNVNPARTAPVTARVNRLMILRRFWRVALPSAATALAAGIAAAYLYLGTFSNLWTTAYGRMLLAKVVLVAGIGGCGFVNWRRLRRWNGMTIESLAIVVVEVALAIAVVLVTGLLTETAHPG